MGLSQSLAEIDSANALKEFVRVDVSYDSTLRCLAYIKKIWTMWI